MNAIADTFLQCRDEGLEGAPPNPTHNGGYQDRETHAGLNHSE